MVSKMGDVEYGGPGGGSSGPRGEQPIEVRRQLHALRRSWIFVACFVLAVTAGALFASLSLPNKYRSTATIVQDDTFTSGPSDVDSVKRRLETIDRLLKTSVVLDRAASLVPGETTRSIRRTISSSVDPGANVIDVSVETRSRTRSALIANAVAGSLLKTQADVERRGIASARAKLLAQLARLRSSAVPAAEIQALRDRISELTIAEATIGSDLRLAQPAQPATKPFSPTPIRNAIIAFFAALFLAVLFVVGRDLLRPKVVDAPELSRIMRLPVFATVPFAGRRLGARTAVLRAVADEAFQTLQASVRYALGDEGTNVLLVTSAVEGEGKTTTAVGLARALSRVGRRTLLVCADFRLPTLHEHFNISRGPGLSDVLWSASVSRGQADLGASLRSVMQTNLGAGRLDVIPSGARVDDPAALLFGGPLDSLLAVLEEFDYDYVIIDGPPLLGVADGQALAQRVAAVLIAARLDRLTVEQAREARERLDRLGSNAIGLVVSARWQPSAYAYSYSYVTSKPSEGSLGVRGRELPTSVSRPASSPGPGASQQPR
jgi:capsular exopolysaccharide synthesis family protein